MTDDEMMNTVLRSRSAMSDPSVTSYVMARTIAKAIKHLLHK